MTRELVQTDKIPAVSSGKPVVLKLPCSVEGYLERVKLGFVVNLGLI